MTDTGLPPNWAIRVSKTHNKEYFLNQATKESAWEPPFGTDKDKLDRYLVKFRENRFKPIIPSDGKVRATHLLIKNTLSRRPKSWKHPDGVTLSRDEAVQKMRGFQTRILNGEVKIGDLARTESDCSSHSNGGDLGFFARGEMQPPLEEATYGLHVGEISDIVETDSGIHLIQRTA